MKKKKQSKTLGEMTKVRAVWGFNSSTRVVKNGKAYNRQQAKKIAD